MESSKMKLLGFGVENFRVFKDYEWFDFAPLTILTGKNNSGKSSLIKAIRLFSNSIKQNNGLYLDFYDSDLKLGSFDETRNRNNKDSDDILFSFKTILEDPDTSFYNECTFFSGYNKDGMHWFEVDVNDEALIEIHGKFDGSTFNYTRSFIRLADEILDNEKLKKQFNSISFHDFNKIKSEIKNFLERDNRMHTSNDYWNKYILEQKSHPLFNVTNAIKNALENISKQKNDRSGKHIPILEEILSQEIKNSVEDSILKEPVSQYVNKNDIEFHSFPEDFFSNSLDIDIIESVRAEQSIIFKDSDNPRLADTFRNYEKLTKDSQIEGKNTFEVELPRIKREFINLWLREFGMTDNDSELHITRISGYGYNVSINKNGRDMHLTELGYGFTQLLPMIMKILMAKNNIIIIEEPEANLHPALQSLLADFFVDASELFNIQFIIETHSEYLIRKLQYLTAKTDNNLNPEDIVIYYFNHPTEVPKGERQIKQIKIQPDGSLTDDFGAGFFDEADNIALDIFLLKNSQRN